LKNTNTNLPIRTPVLNKSNFIYFLLSITLVFNACKSKENTVRRNFVTPKTTKNIIEEATKNMFEFDWVSGKFSADVVSDNKKTSFNTNFRIKNDSVIWFSISPALGIEVARVLITQDTVKFVNRLNNTYFVGDYKYINKMFNVDADYKMIESLLLGNPNFNITDEEDEHLKSSIDDDHYLVSTMKKRKLQKELKKNDPSDLVVHSFWLDSENFKLKKFQFNDFNMSRKLIVDYGEQKSFDDLLFPNFINMVLSGSNSAEIKMNFQKIKKEEQQNVPFNIPSKFEKIE
jgi:hypothetical protein